MKTIALSGYVVLRKSLFLIGVVAVMATVVALVTTSVLGRSDTDTPDGTTAPGSHEWWSLGDTEANFCNGCHSLIATELGAGQHKGTSQSACLFCHGAGTGQHAADPAECVDCHSSEAGELNTDAHAGFYSDLSEDDTSASWTCKACHTKVAIEMTSETMADLPLSQTAEVIP